MNLIKFVKTKYELKQKKKQEEYDQGIRYMNQWGFLTKIGSAVFAKGAYVINLMLGFLAGLIFRLGGWLIEAMLSLNAHILDPEFNPFLYTVWEIFLNLANLALILGIVYVAFATILRMEDYRKNRLLFRIIFAALIINFSLVLAGIFIDIAGVLSEFFTNSFNDTAGIATTIAGAFNPQGLLEIKAKNTEDFAGAFTALTNATFMAIGSIVLSTLFTIAAAVVLLAIAFLLLRRYIELTWRLALLPVVIIAWTFPFKAGGIIAWSKWKQEFMRWTFFAPVMLFLVFLSLRALQLNNMKFTTANLSAGINPANVESTMQLAEVAGIASTTPAPNLAASNTQAGKSIQDSVWFSVNNLMGMVMAMAFLLYSLKLASSWSIAGAKTFEGWTNSVNKGVGNWAKKKGRQYASAPLRAQKVQDWASKGQRVGTTGNWFKRKFIAAPVVRTASKLAYAGGVKQGKAIISDSSKKIEKMSEDDLARDLLNLSPQDRIAAIEKIVKAKKVGKIPPDILDTLLADSSYKDQAARFGSKDAFGKLEKAAGKNGEMIRIYNEKVKDQTARIDAEIEKVNADTSLDPVAKKEKLDFHAGQKADIEESSGFRKATKEFFKGFDKEHWDSIGPSSVVKISPDPQKKISSETADRHNFFTQVVMNEIVKENPGSVGPLVGKAKTGQINEVMEKFQIAEKEAVKSHLQDAIKIMTEAGVKKEDISKLEEAIKDAKMTAKDKAELIREMTMKTTGENREKMADLYSKAIHLKKVKENSLNKRLFGMTLLEEQATTEPEAEAKPAEEKKEEKKAA